MGFSPRSILVPIAIFALMAILVYFLRPMLELYGLSGPSAEERAAMIAEGFNKGAPADMGIFRVEGAEAEGKQVRVNATVDEGAWPGLDRHKELLVESLCSKEPIGDFFEHGGEYCSVVNMSGSSPMEACVDVSDCPASTARSGDREDRESYQGWSKEWFAEHYMGEKKKDVWDVNNVFDPFTGQYAGSVKLKARWKYNRTDKESYMYEITDRNPRLIMRCEVQTSNFKVYFHPDEVRAFGFRCDKDEDENALNNGAVCTETESTILAERFDDGVINGRSWEIHDAAQIYGTMTSGWLWAEGPAFERADQDASFVRRLRESEVLVLGSETGKDAYLFDTRGAKEATSVIYNACSGDQ